MTRDSTVQERLLLAYVLMALTEEVWLDDHYGASYQEYRERTARFFDAQGFVLALLDKMQPSRRTS